MKRILCPSMMCADFDCLKAEVEALDQAGADLFHKSHLPQLLPSKSAICLT